MDMTTNLEVDFETADSFTIEALEALAASYSAPDLATLQAAAPAMFEVLRLFVHTRAINWDDSDECPLYKQAWLAHDALFKTLGLR